MSNHWILIDTPYLCHRAKHAIPQGSMEHNGKDTRVIFGVLDSLVWLGHRFPNSHFCLCWDLGLGKRVTHQPGYKANRRESLATATQEEQESYHDFQRQYHLLRESVLPDIGWPCYFEKGYEADDMIASLAKAMAPSDRATIVSSDQDLWQLLGPRVRQWHPSRKKYTTHKGFEEQWGIRPSQWALVKALAGCSTDNVPGVKGVGEKKAAQWVAGGMPSHWAVVPAIQAALVPNGLVEQNIRVVALPYPGTPTCTPTQGRATAAGWRAACGRYGLAMLANCFPYDQGRPSRAKGVRQPKKGLGI